MSNPAAVASVKAMHLAEGATRDYLHRADTWEKFRVNLPPTEREKEYARRGYEPKI